jgi:hypothetical protein
VPYTPKTFFHVHEAGLEVRVTQLPLYLPNWLVLHVFLS